LLGEEAVEGFMEKMVFLEAVVMRVLAEGVDMAAMRAEGGAMLVGARWRSWQ
jgi:hypothetical protein